MSEETYRRPYTITIATSCADEAPRYDIVASEETERQFQAFLDGRQTHIDMQIVSADTLTQHWVRITPQHYRTAEHSFTIDDGTCQLNVEGQTTGTLHSCNGHFVQNTVPGYSAGKLDVPSL